MSGRFAQVATPMVGLHLLEKKRLSDSRGYLTRLFDAEELSAFGWRSGIFQINETGTAARGTVRGLHFQHPPFAEAKLVTCIAGRILDVAVDIRRGSPTFLQHFAVELSAENGLSLLIPEGFAHGFQSLEDDVRMIYAHSAPYRAEAEAGISPLDAVLGINWPLEPVHLSERDLGFAPLDGEFSGIVT